MAKLIIKCQKKSTKNKKQTPVFGMFSTNTSKSIFVSVFPMLQYPIHHPASQHRITDGSLFCQTCNSAISRKVTHKTAVEFSKRPRVHMESRENVFGIPLGGPSTGRLYTAKVSCLLQSCWKHTEVGRHGNQLTTLTSTFLGSLGS